MINKELEAIYEKYSSICKISIDRISYKQARNAYYARHRVQKMYSGEKYSLQIDSHMRLVQNWDKKLKEYLSQCPNPSKSIISVYPRGYQRDKFEQPQKLEGPLAMCLKEFSKIDNLPRFSSRLIMKSDQLSKPFTSLFWAAGFSFSFGSLIADCGYTSEVDDVFFGEELY